MKVVATQQGQYDQVFREVGEVFVLFGDINDEGKDPEFPYPYRAKVYTPKKDGKGRVIEDEFDESDAKDKEGNHIHVDFAEDTGPKMIRRGPKKGEVSRTGWMLKVPEETPVGLYPTKDDVCQVNFWANMQLPQPIVREYGPMDKRMTGKIRTAA